jgi:tetratricopeptide (TPR) repeat protein
LARAAALAASTSPLFRYTLPPGIRLLFCLPADSLLPGQTPAQEANCETLPNTLMSTLRRRRSQLRTQNPEAYALYLKGRSYRDKQTRADLETAVSYFSRAIAKDPGYALAYAGLADAYALLPDHGASPSEDIPKSKLPPAKHLSWTLPWPVLTSIWAAP